MFHDVAQYISNTGYPVTCICGTAHENLALVAQASSEVSDECAHAKNGSRGRLKADSSHLFSLDTSEGFSCVYVISVAI